MRALTAFLVFAVAGPPIGAAIGCWLISQGILRLFGKALQPKGN